MCCNSDPGIQVVNKNVMKYYIDEFLRLIDVVIIKFISIVNEELLCLWIPYIQLLFFTFEQKSYLTLSLLETKEIFL